MSKFRWLAGGIVVVALIAAITVAVWPQSDTERARQDGKHLGNAVAELRNAKDANAVHDGLYDLGNALQDTREHAADRVFGHIQAQGDAIYRAVDGYLGQAQSDDSWDDEAYSDELNTAVSDLSSNADDFRSTGPEVQQAFWQGVQDGLSS